MIRNHRLLSVLATVSVLSVLGTACSGSDDSGSGGASQEQGSASGKDGDAEPAASFTKAHDRLMQNAAVQSGFDFIEGDHDRTVADQIEITEVPAPPFKETKRAQYYRGRLQQAGLTDVRQDKEGNVFGTWKGSGNGPTLFVSAHLDTVFPQGTDVTVTKRDGRLHAPGIGDDGRGLAAVLSIVRAMRDAGVETQGDVVFGGTVGEEGLGDLRGVKHFFDEGPPVDGFISMEAGPAKDITYLATGSHRYEVTYKGPGGHSFGDFGRPSPVHAMGRAISQIADLETESDPKTTFTVGTVQGGTSVNSIAAEASMQIDMRSNDEDNVVELDERVQKIVEGAAEDENERWDTDQLSVDVEQVGDRPAATQEPKDPMVQTAMAATDAVGQDPVLDEPSSTDSNYPMSLGIPALTLGAGGKGENTHAPNEWFDPTDAYRGPQHAYLTILGLVGVQGGGDPLLPRSEQDSGS